MRTNIDDKLIANARKRSRSANRKQTVEQALRVTVKLRQQQEVGEAFGKYPWAGNLSRSRSSRRTA